MSLPPILPPLDPNLFPPGMGVFLLRDTLPHDDGIRGVFTTLASAEACAYDAIRGHLPNVPPRPGCLHLAVEEIAPIAMVPDGPEVRRWVFRPVSEPDAQEFDLMLEWWELDRRR